MKNPQNPTDLEDIQDDSVDKPKFSISALLAQKKTLYLILFLGIIGIVMIILSDWSTPTEVADEIQDELVYDIASYESQLESKIQEIISPIEGVGKAKILVTLKSSDEVVYAKETSVGSSSFSANPQSEERYILVSDSGGKNALKLKTLPPAVCGVVIVCEGGDNPKVVMDITKAVTIACDILTTNVAVIKGF